MIALIRRRYLAYVYILLLQFSMSILFWHSPQKSANSAYFLLFSLAHILLPQFLLFHLLQQKGCSGVGCFFQQPDFSLLGYSFSYTQYVITTESPSFQDFLLTHWLTFFYSRASQALSHRSSIASFSDCYSAGLTGADRSLQEISMPLHLYALIL